MYKPVRYAINKRFTVRNLTKEMTDSSNPYIGRLDQWRSQRGVQGPRPETCQFVTTNVHVYCSIKCTASALTRPASRPQQRACAHLYADAVLPVQYTGIVLGQ